MTPSFSLTLCSFRLLTVTCHLKIKLIKNTLIVLVNYYETVYPSLWKVPSWKGHSVQIQMYATQICALFGFMLFRSLCTIFEKVYKHVRCKKDDNICQRKSNFLGHKCQAIGH